MIRLLSSKLMYKVAMNYSGSNPYVPPADWYETNTKMLGFGGANGSSYYTYIHRLPYSTETISLLGNGVTNARVASGTTGNASVAYNCGGINTSTVSTTEKHTYSTDTCAANASSISTVKHNLAGSGNNTIGYITGGRSGATNYATVEKATYDVDTFSTVTAAALITGRGNHCSTSAGTFLYTGPGYNGSANGKFEKMLFSTETQAALTDLATRYGYSMFVSTTANFVGLGFNGSTQLTSTQKVPFATDTAAASATWPNANSTNGSQSTTVGYAVGGNASGYSTTGQKLTFATETAALNTLGNFSNSINGVMCCG